MTEPYPSPTSGESEDEINFLQILNVLLMRWRLVVGFPLATAVLVVGISFLFPPTYSAKASFVPESPSRGRLGALGNLSGLAGQLGIAVGSEPSLSPRFYASVAKSREIFDSLLLARYPDPRSNSWSGDSVSLLRILRSGGHNRPDSIEQGAKKLAQHISLSVDAQTNIVTVRVTLQYPELASVVANRLVAQLNAFNTETRQSQARERRKFVQQRVAGGEQELHQSEEALKHFYQANRSWQQAPQLVFEEGRLRRQVELRQEVYLTLRRDYETARIEEVNDTPVITVIEPATVPQRKSGPRRGLWALLGFVLGGIVSLIWAFGSEYMARAKREHNQPYSDLEATARQVTAELRRTAGSVVSPFARKVR